MTKVHEDAYSKLIKYPVLEFQCSRTTFGPSLKVLSINFTEGDLAYTTKLRNPYSENADQKKYAENYTPEKV